MGSLVEEVDLRLPRDECPPIQCPGCRWPWLGGQDHRGGAYTRVCNLKVRIDYPHTKYDDSGLSLTDVSNFLVKVYHL